MHVRTHTHAHTHTHKESHAPTCMCTCTHGNTHGHTHVYTHIHTHICMPFTYDTYGRKLHLLLQFVSLAGLYVFKVWTCGVIAMFFVFNCAEWLCRYIYIYI